MLHAKTLISTVLRKDTEDVLHTLRTQTRRYTLSKMVVLITITTQVLHCVDKYAYMTHTYNAGNFQEFDYECEHIECDWKRIYGTNHLVTAFTYPFMMLYPFYNTN